MFDWTKPLDPEAILNEFGNMIYKLALSQLKSTQDAEDVFQEVFVRLVKYKPVVTSKEHAKAWLIRVTINCCKDIFAHPLRDQVDELTDWNTPAVSPPMTEDSVLAHVRALPPLYREVIHLFYYEDMSVETIAQVLERKESTVKSQLHRGRNLLRERLLGGEVS